MVEYFICYCEFNCGVIMTTSIQVQRIRDEVLTLLADNPHMRDDDLPLLLEVWRRRGVFVLKSEGAEWVSSETVRRARQIVQERHPELGPTSACVIERRLRKSKDMKRIGRT